MDTEKLGAISKEHREALNLSVVEVGRVIGKHVSNVYRFEHGEHKDPRGYILAYAMLGNSEGYLNKVFPIVKEEMMNG